jgi:hypothetical protein
MDRKGNCTLQARDDIKVYSVKAIEIFQYKEKLYLALQ